VSHTEEYASRMAGSLTRVREGCATGGSAESVLCLRSIEADYLYTVVGENGEKYANYNQISE